MAHIAPRLHPQSCFFVLFFGYAAVVGFHPKKWEVEQKVLGDAMCAPSQKNKHFEMEGNDFLFMEL